MRCFLLNSSCSASMWVRLLSFTAAIGLTSSFGVNAQSQTSPSPPETDQAETDGVPLFRSGTTLVRTDVIVRDENGLFVPNLVPEDFVIEEEGLPQEVASLVLVHGGRVQNMLTPGAAVQEGIILPSSRPVNNSAGRIFIFFIDELHLDPQMTPKVRHFIKEVGETLVHEGDLFGMITNGPTRVTVNLTYDREFLNAAADKLLGTGLTPRELIFDLQRGPAGPRELAWRAHQAFRTVRDSLDVLREVEDRRKVLIYVSTGYDLNPYSYQREYRTLLSTRRLGFGDAPDFNGFELEDPINRIQRQGAVFRDGDLVQELTEVTDAANRANTTVYTIDPRGLVSTPDIDVDVPLEDWTEHMRETRTSLQTLAELTGGMAIVNTNNFDDLLRQIDAETSDYYIVGYYTTEPGGLEGRTRALDVSVKREGVSVRSRTSYTFSRKPGTSTTP